eukprot:jgi/Ulvmu1/6408/UM003_0037.1
MKICDKEFTKDQAILTVEGSLICMEAAALFAAPTTVQDKAFKTGSTHSNPMTRIAGIGLGGAGLHVIAAGCSDDRKVQQRAAKIVAGQSAVVAGLAAMQLAGKEADRVSDQNKLIGVAALTAANAAVMAWRGFKKDDD